MMRLLDCYFIFLLRYAIYSLMLRDRIHTDDTRYFR